MVKIKNGETIVQVTIGKDNHIYLDNIKSRYKMIEEKGIFLFFIGHKLLIRKVDLEGFVGIFKQDLLNEMNKRLATS